MSNPPPALQLHERLSFDLTSGQVLDGPRRYLLMRIDVLMGAFDNLPEPARTQALQALGHSVTRHGGDSVRQYLAEIGPGALLRAMEQASASLGWGCWTLRHERGTLHLEVRNSPFAAGTRHHDGPVCHAITGMLTALATALWSAPAEARELRCACCDATGQHICVFEAVRQAQ